MSPHLTIAVAHERIADLRREAAHAHRAPRTSRRRRRRHRRRALRLAAIRLARAVR